MTDRELLLTILSFVTDIATTLERATIIEPDRESVGEAVNRVHAGLKTEVPGELIDQARVWWRQHPADAEPDREPEPEPDPESTPDDSDPAKRPLTAEEHANICKVVRALPNTKLAYLVKAFKTEFGVPTHATIQDRIQQWKHVDWISLWILENE